MNALLLPVALVAVALSPATGAASTLLTYEAPRDCPTEPEFRAAIAAHGADVAPGSSSDPAPDPARVLAVTIRRQSGGFGGAFQVREGRGATERRTVTGRTCGDVADALALVTAIALAASPSDAAATGASRAVAAPPPVAAVEPPPDAAPRPWTEGLRGSTRFAPPRTEIIQVGAGPLRFNLSRAAMLYAGGVSGLVPGILLPRYSLTLTTAHFVTTPAGDQRIAGLVMQLHADYLGNATYQSRDTRTQVVGSTFGIDFCQSPHYDSRGLALLLCGEYGGGYLNLETKGPDGATMQTKNAGFGQLSAVVDAEYTLGSRFVLGARLGGSFMLGDITAERADGSRIFSSSHWSAYATLGAGFRF